VVGVVRLFARRGRRLIVAFLPTTAVICWFVVRSLVARTDGAWLTLVFLGPAAAPFLVLAPSVGRWLETSPERRAHPFVGQPSAG
jgi:hypothetical protein